MFDCNFDIIKKIKKGFYTMNNDVLFSSKSDEWATPADLSMS